MSQKTNSLWENILEREAHSDMFATHLCSSGSRGPQVQFNIQFWAGEASTKEGLLPAQNWGFMVDSPHKLESRFLGEISITSDMKKN